jgi:hypothetical protein
MSEFVERKCNSVTSVSSVSFTCQGFPAFNEGGFDALAGRYYPAQIIDSSYTTSVRWTS